MSKIFKLHNISKAITSWNTNNFNIDDTVSQHPKRLFVFLVGGSGSSIIKPFLHFFYSKFKGLNYILTTIIIDRNFNSHIVSNAILEISMHRKFMQYICDYDNAVSMPYFFCEDKVNNLINSKKFNQILSLIKAGDKVLVSYSIQNNDNCIIAKFIQQSLCHTKTDFYQLIFLPYFNLSNQKAEVDLEAEIESYDINKAMQHYLKELSSNEDSFGNLYFLGKNPPSLYENMDYQRNPFHMVNLIGAYGLLHASLNSTNERQQVFEFGISCGNNELHPDDVIKDTFFRKELVCCDMLYVCWNYLRNCNNPIFNKVDPEIIQFVDKYLEESINMISDLGDSLLHLDQVMYLRNNKLFNNHVHRNFNYKIWGIIFTMSSKNFQKSLLKEININHLVNNNMIISEILKSIRCFIRNHYTEIDRLYF